MVEFIGLVTMCALVWVIASSMAGESESEKRRMSMYRESGRSAESATGEVRTRLAA